MNLHINRCFQGLERSSPYINQVSGGHIWTREVGWSPFLQPGQKRQRWAELDNCLEAMNRFLPLYFSLWLILAQGYLPCAGRTFSPWSYRGQEGQCGVEAISRVKVTEGGGWAKTRIRRRHTRNISLEENQWIGGQISWWKNLGKFECLSQITENIMVQERLRTTNLKKRVTNQEEELPQKPSFGLNLLLMPLLLTWEF